MSGTAFDLDIVTVSYESDAHILRNVSLMKSLNPGFSYRYIVVKNDPGPSALENCKDIVLVPGTPPRSSDPGEGSYHHAEGIHEGMKHVTSRYVLVLDPDFFVVVPNWMSKVTAHARENDLSFLGALWSPVKIRKYRYFPCVHFMLIDALRVPVKELDFSPDFHGSNWRSQLVESLPLPYSWRRVLLIGNARDTGWKIKRTYYRRPGFQTEYMTSVVKYREFRDLRKMNPYPKWVVRRIPDKWSLMPKKPCCRFEGYLTQDGRLEERAWEEFWWQDQLFAIHLRNVGRREKLSELGDDQPHLDYLFEEKLGLKIQPTA